MRRPLEGSYWTTLALVVLALAPNIVVTTAYFLLLPQQLKALHTTATALEIVEGLSNAGYAFGALLGGDLIQRFRQRTLFVGCEAAFVAGSLLAATSGGLVAYGSGRALQGLATGLLLVIAVPPLVQRFPASRMPVTTATIDIAFFGAVCVGPLIAGAVAHAGAWRWFTGGLGGLGLIGLALGVLALPDQKPPNRGMRFDATAVGLALLATVLPFLAVSKLRSAATSFVSPLFLALLVAGLAALVALLLTQYHRDEPLSPVRPLSSTLPTIGTLAATIGGGVFLTLVALAEQSLTQIDLRTPLATGLQFWPQVLGVAIGAALLGRLVRTRFLPHLTLAGMLFLIAGAALLLTIRRGASDVFLLGLAGTLGLGAGMSVSPGLWIAGMSLPAKLVGRTFALVELIRSVGDYLMGPVLLKTAAVTGKESPQHGLRTAIAATLVVAVAGTLLGCVLWLAGGARAREPDLEGWLEGDESALDSPPPFARLRKPQ